jgi:hypothetical protein
LRGRFVPFARDESHLTVCASSIGAMRMGFNDLPDELLTPDRRHGPEIRTVERVAKSLSADHSGRADRLLMVFLRQVSRIARVSTNASIPYLPYSRPTPEYLNPPQGACGSSVMPLITTRPARN